MNGQTFYIIVFGFVERLSTQNRHRFLRIALDHLLSHEGLDYVLGLVTEKGQIQVLRAGAACESAR
jgi:hypothetical protein